MVNIKLDTQITNSVVVDSFKVVKTINDIENNTFHIIYDMYDENGQLFGSDSTTITGTTQISDIYNQIEILLSSGLTLEEAFSEFLSNIATDNISNSVNKLLSSGKIKRVK